MPAIVRPALKKRQFHFYGIVFGLIKVFTDFKKKLYLIADIPCTFQSNCAAFSKSIAFKSVNLKAN
jgi:hypothetical protein